MGLVREGSYELIHRWEAEILPALTEIQLMASQEVSDLADRAAHGILTASPQMQYPGTDRERIVPTNYHDYWPTSQCARDLVDVLRNAMRGELGLGPVENTAARDPDWPWLASQTSVDQHRERQSARGHPSARGWAEE